MDQIDFDAARPIIVGQPVNTRLPSESALLERELVRGARADYTPENANRSYTKRITFFSIPKSEHILALGTYRNTRGPVVVVNPDARKKRALALSKALRAGFAPLASIRLKRAYSGVRFLLSRNQYAAILETASE